jgi:hypothetical protein
MVKKSRELTADDMLPLGLPVDVVAFCVVPYCVPEQIRILQGMYAAVNALFYDEGYCKTLFDVMLMGCTERWRKAKKNQRKVTRGCAPYMERVRFVLFPKQNDAVAACKDAARHAEMVTAREKALVHSYRRRLCAASTMFAGQLKDVHVTCRHNSVSWDTTYVRCEDCGLKTTVI